MCVLAIMSTDDIPVSYPTVIPDHTKIVCFLVGVLPYGQTIDSMVKQ